MSAASEPVTLNQPLSGTRLRIVSAIVMIVPAIAAVYFGPPWFTALIIAAAIAMAWEWSRMCNRDPFWLVVGAIYIAVPCGILIWLRQGQQAGMITIYGYFYWCGAQIPVPIFLAAPLVDQSWPPVSAQTKHGLAFLAGYRLPAS